MLEYNVYYENFNKKQIEVYNIFKYSFLEELFRDIKNKSTSKEEFAEKIDFELKYRYWAKCEWEIILSDWPPSNTFKKEKIDVYDQIKLNWNIFVDYVWENL